MVDVNGIPRALDLGRVWRELGSLRREMERATSARTYVTIGNIVEGGTIGQGVGQQLTETVQKDIVIESGNLGDTALNDRVITGSLVQTRPEPEVGSKMTDDGFVAHGRARVSPSIDTKVRSILGARPAPGDTGGYIQPGLWLEAVPDDGYPYTPPEYSAGVYASDAFAGGAAVRSARSTVDSAYSEHRVAAGWSSWIVYGPEESPDTLARRETRAQLTQAGAFDLSAVNPGTPGSPGTVHAGVRHEGDGVLHLVGVNGVKVNGEPINGGGGPPVEMPTTKITEFTCTGTKGNRDGNNQEISLPIYAAAGSNASLAASDAGSLILLADGVYGVDFQLALFSDAGFTSILPTTGRSFLDIASGGNAAYTRTGIAVGEDQATAALSGKLFRAGDKIKFRFYQWTGTTAYYRATIRLIKHP